MVFFTLHEIIDLAIMTLAIGYIFSTFIKRQPEEGYDPLTYYRQNSFFQDLKYGILIAAPAVVLHELAHKFVAMAFGAQAILSAPYGWYVLAIVLRLINFPIFFFVGGIVMHTALPPLQSALVAGAGPFLNLIMWALCYSAVRFKIVKRKQYNIFTVMARLNLFLFIFNMIPLPGLDGFSFFSELIKVFFR